MQNKRKVDIVQEVYETYQDIKNRNITLTRLYIILILTMIISFGFLCLVMLFLKQFAASFLFFIITSLGVTLLKKRKRKIVARYLDWFSFLGGALCIVITVAYNVYEYSNIAGSLIYIIMLVNMIYIIFVSDDIQKNKVAYVVCVLLVVVFIDLILLDNFVWHTDLLTTNFHEILFLINIFVIFVCIVLAAFIVGLKSVESVEMLEENRRKIILESNKNKHLDYLYKKDFGNSILQKQKSEYNDLNICVFEISLFTNDESAAKIEYFCLEKIINDFLNLLKIYYPNEKMLIKWDLNTVVLIVEDSSDNMFLMLESINKDFDKIVKNKQECKIYLKSICKYYKSIVTKKHPKIILEKINEVIKLKFETSNLGKKYTLYKSDFVRNINGK